MKNDVPKVRNAFPANFYFNVFIIFFFAFVPFLLDSPDFSLTDLLNPAGVIFTILFIGATYDIHRGGIVGYVLQWAILMLAFVGAVTNAGNGSLKIMLLVAPLLMVDLIVNVKNLNILRNKTKYD